MPDGGFEASCEQILTFFDRLEDGNFTLSPARLELLAYLLCYADMARMWAKEQPGYPDLGVKPSA